MRTVLGLGLVATVLAGCGDDDPGSSAERLSVVASFHPLAEAARAAGGDLVSVDDLTPAGAEPHDLELSTRQLEALLDADVVLVMGDGFQPAVEEVAIDRDGPTVVVLDLPELGVDDHHEEDGDHDDGDDHGHGDLDPHVWLDPTKMAVIVDAVADALDQADPAHADEYRANAARTVGALTELDGSFRRTLASCRQRTLVTAHAAFGWLADRYDLRQEAIAGLSPEQEPDPRRLAELTDLVEREGVTTVFTEALVSPKVAETLAREAGVDTAVLDPLESGEDDYVTAMERNLVVLADALDCED